MLFNTYEFMFGYLPMVLGSFFAIARWRHRAAAIWLALASLFFYGWWNPKFVTLLLASIAFNYLAGVYIGRSTQPRAKVLLIAALAVNLSLLAAFKYANFFINTVNDAGGQLPALNVVLPLGISFFTFTQIAFLVDVYRGLTREFDFIHYVLFVTWFPHLIAGPVLHHKQMMPQFAQQATYRINGEAICVGLTLFAIGLAKKVMLADQFAWYANPVFNSAATGGQPALVDAWIGALAYTFQLYFDFSGYSDMAVGLSRMFNVRLPLNFDSPYKAASIIDFWRRWHMTLSKFLRDYLYVPLGGNRKGALRRHVNLLITMLLGGLWHGAGWTFVLWGGLHGVYLIVNHAYRWLTGSSGRARNALTHACAILITFIAVVVAWVPFRADSMAAAAAVWRGMAGANGLTSGVPVTMGEIGWLLLGLLIAWLLPNSQQWLARFKPAWDEVTAHPYLAWRPTPRHAIMVGALLGISLVSLNRVSQFLYFEF